MNTYTITLNPETLSLQSMKFMMSSTVDGGNHAHKNIQINNKNNNI